MDISFALRKFRKSIAGFTILALLASFVSFSGVALASFDDTDGHWAESYINDLVDLGVVSGYDNGNFGPDDTLTRAQLAKIAVLAFLGEDLVETDEGVFDDVDSGAWYADYVYTAYLYGLVSGYEDASGELTGEFGPNDEVNRAAAAKILVNAAGLTLTTAGGPHFDDVASSAWYYEYVETAYLYSILDGYGDGTYGPGDAVTRGQVAKMTMNALDPSYRGDDDDDDDTTPSTGALEVALSSDTPEGATVPDYATSLPVVTWDFTATSDDVEIDEIIVHQFSISTLSTDHQLYLYEGDTRLTSGTTINSSTFEAKFNNLNLTIDKGDTRSLTVRFDVGSNNSSDELAVELESVDSVVANTSDVSGDFPLQGETFTIASDDAGSITITKNGTITSPKVGEDSVTIGKFKLAAAGEAADVERIGLLLSGTISTGDVENFELYVSGETDPVATVAAVDSNDIINFVLDTPYSIEKGGSKSFTVMADFNTGRTSDTVKVYLDEDTDLVARGGTYGYGMVVYRSSGDTVAGSYDGTSCTSGSGDCSYTSLVGGDVTISSDGPAASDIAVNGKDVPLLNFTITAVSEVTFKKFPMSLTPSESADTTEGLLNSTAANFTDIKVSNADTGDELMTSFDATALVTTISGSTAITEASGDEAEAYHIFTDNFTMDAGEELNLTLSVDVANTSTLSGMTVYATLPLGDSTSYPEIRDVNNKALTNTSILVPAADVTGKTMTVQSPSLTLSLASTPVSGVTYVKGANDVPFTGLVFACGEASDCTVTDLTLYGYIDENSTGGFTVATDNSVTVTQIVGSVALWDGTDADTANVIAAAKSVNSSTGAVTYTNMGWTIDAGETAVVYVVGDVSSSAYVNSTDEDILFEISATTDVTAEDEDGNTISSISGTPNSDESNYVTITGGGVLTVAVAGDTAKENIFVAGDTNNEVSKFKFTATKEPFIVSSLSINNRQNGVADTNIGNYDNNVKSVTISYENSDGDTETKTGYLTNGTAKFSGMDMYVGKDETAYLTVYADLNTISSGSAAQGEFVDLALAYNNFEALAQSSGVTYKADRSDATYIAAGSAYLQLDSLSTSLYGATWVDPTAFSADGAVTMTLGSTVTFYADNNGADQTNVQLPVGTLVCFDASYTTAPDASTSASCGASDTIVIVQSYTDGSTEDTYTGIVVDNAGGDTADNEQLLYALPGTGYHTNTNQMVVYESKPTLALSSSSPTAASASSTEKPFVFTVTSDSEEDIKMRYGVAGDDETDVDAANFTAAGAAADADVVAGTAGGDFVDGTNALTVTATTGQGFIADGDCFVIPTALTAGSGQGQLGYHEYVSFWLEVDADISVTWDSLGFVLSNDTDCGTTGTAVEKVLGDAANDDYVFVNGTSLAGLGTTAMIGGAGTATDVADQWELVTIDIGANGLNYSNLATATNWGFSVDNGTNDFANGDVWRFDQVVFHNEMLVIDIASPDADLNIDQTTAQLAYLKDSSGNNEAVSAVGYKTTSAGSILFVPTSTEGDLEFTKGTTSTLSLQLDTTTLLDNDTGVDDPITYSIGLGTSSGGTVTPGDFWWYETNATVRWAGLVSNTTLSSNTLKY